MDRHTFSEGFLLADTCIALFLISGLSLLYLSFPSGYSQKYERFADSYLHVQTKAMALAEHQTFEQDGIQVVFNEAGNVRKAMTVPFPERKASVIVELGGGRLVFR